MSIILFIVVLLILVLVHEFGHFIVAKRNGIRVDEFGFGFPPRLFSFRKGETLYSLNALPFGGFVKIFGENPNEESIKGPDSARSLASKPRHVQAAVLVAGVFFNLILAWLLFSAAFMAGMPSSFAAMLKNKYAQNLTIVIKEVLPASPAENAGLMKEDIIVGMTADGVMLKELTPAAIQQFIASHGQGKINLDYRREGIEKNATLTPEISLLKNTPAIGIAMSILDTPIKVGFFEAIWDGLRLTGHIISETVFFLVQLVGQAFVGQADIKSVSGPVGIVGMVGDAYQFGMVYLVVFVGFISVNLAVINLMPFPALDGGRLLFLLIEKIKGSPIKPVIGNTLNLFGFFLLIALLVVVTYHDIVKLLSP